MTQELFTTNDDDFIKWYKSLECSERNLARLAAVGYITWFKAMIQKIIDGDGTQQPVGVLNVSDYD